MRIPGIENWNECISTDVLHKLFKQHNIYMTQNLPLHTDQLEVVQKVLHSLTSVQHFTLALLFKVNAHSYISMSSSPEL